jgi:hypothetical protein
VRFLGVYFKIPFSHGSIKREIPEKAAGSTDVARLAGNS